MANELLTPVRLICSDELGLFKVVQAPDINKLDNLTCAVKWGEPDKSRSIECLTLQPSTYTPLVAAGRLGGQTDIMDSTAGTVQATIPVSTADNSSGKLAAIRGLHFINPSASTAGAAEHPMVLSCTQGGAVRVYGPQSDAISTWDEVRSWNVPTDVCCTAYDAGSNALAIGCKGAELRFFDIETGTLSYQAKGGKPNMVGLVDPAWNSALAFVPGSEGKRVVVGTGHHKFRLYDANIGKRPQIDVNFGEASRITALAPEPDGMRCWVANGLGQLEVFDFRAGRFSGAIRGIAGSIRSLSLHPDKPMIASAGLDRFLRIHDTNTRKSVGKVYLKSQLTGVEFAMEAVAPSKEAPGGQDGEEEERGGGGKRNRPGGDAEKKKKKKKGGSKRQHD